jgi:hypothetical protein
VGGWAYLPGSMQNIVVKKYIFVEAHRCQEGSAPRPRGQAAFERPPWLPLAPHPAPHWGGTGVLETPIQFRIPFCADS